MEHKFDNREFEQFVKQSADQYRMFPSEKVWKGINNTLHTRRRWYEFGFALLLLTTAAVTGIMLNPSDKKQSELVRSTALLVKKNTLNTGLDKVIVHAPVKAKINNSTPSVSPDNTQNNLFNTGNIALVNKENSSLPDDLNQKSIAVNDQINNDPETPEIFVIKPNTTGLIAKNRIKQTEKQTVFDAVNNITTAIEKIILPEPAVQNIIHNNNPITEADNKIENYSDPNLLTIESVINSYQYSKARKKLTWHLFVTPTITYRKLDENRPFLEAARTTIGATGSYTFNDINSQVTHKPDIGIQLGFSAGYPVTKNITLTGGLQFNVSKYNIRASTSPSEVATIALNTSGGGTNTVSAITNYRNVAGYKAAWLHNKYISASLPIGAEIKLSGNKKTTVGIGATVQPTYILGNRAYLLSTDFKNYAEVPSLTRKWNINTGFEVFAGYKTRKADWRIGPQVRYQVFSSFENKYPIKEHLFDFGVKLGLTLK